MKFFDSFKRDHTPMIKRAFEEMQNMLRIGREMFAAATGFTLDNEILDVDLNKLDSKVNLSEQRLRVDVLTHLSVGPRQELVFSLKLLSIVHEAERIGDLAKTMAGAGLLAKGPRMGPFVLPLRDLRNHIFVMFENTEKCFIEEDEEAAVLLMKEHEKVKDELTAYTKMLADREDITPNEAIVYVLCGRMMSRVSSHLANIASTVASPFDMIRRSSTWRDET